MSGPLSRGLKQLDWVAVRILDLYLTSAWTSFHAVPELNPDPLECRDAAWEIRDSQHDPVPSAGLLLLTIRHRS